MFQEGFIDFLNLFSKNIGVDEGFEPVLWDWGFCGVEFFTGEFFSSQDLIGTFEVIVGEIVGSWDDFVDGVGMRGHGGDEFSGDLFDFFL